MTRSRAPLHVEFNPSTPFHAHPRSPCTPHPHPPHAPNNLPSPDHPRTHPPNERGLLLAGPTIPTCRPDARPTALLRRDVLRAEPHVEGRELRLQLGVLALSGGPGCNTSTSPRCLLVGRSRILFGNPFCAVLLWVPSGVASDEDSIRVLLPAPAPQQSNVRTRVARAWSKFGHTFFSAGAPRRVSGPGDPS